MNLGNIQELIFSQVKESTSQSSRVQLVLELAQALDVDELVTTSEIALAIAERKVREATAALRPVQTGDSVRTSQGDARAVVLDESDVHAFQRVLAALSAAA